MDFEEPLTSGFTIYSKSGCHNCTKFKKLLKENNLFFLEIQCDDYLIEEKERFLSFIENKIGKSWVTFPMVFNDGKFIGGYIEASAIVHKLLLSFEDMF